ncbi:cysteinyl-tRNA synthetase [Oceanospirillum multiglobuliferum]|uniref:Cysteine--tRNA ligase n=1 Tax=Oceanospirillum multiglobuliferum TaxID=64969 RepID=A0A1T4P3P6_9GAMM|nr:cysteine--tRNA ligase [Oceanospirillum multiglobuliferum]OPX54828.1 cysteine--tRNA ligase [Oceanospirillum multiglobuliferum]SJZ86079.1 cysteinyl-tRNA synthetase [Oceanospirillum multiglobuliferum]
MLHIYNTMTRKKEVFTPIEAGKIKMYVCGVTVYDLCHIGHARVMVAFDVITRYLRHRGYEVNYIRNITDVDDKIIRRAAENNEPVDALTERMIQAMHDDEASLNVLRPDHEPRATHHIQDIINMVQTLIDKGYAYVASNGDVYYRVTKFENYGALTNRNLEDMQAGARIGIEEAKENPMDFVLWKSAKADEVSWESPWGAGRPGWHIECSAMSTCCLGNTFDIHGGGPDLPFPHHENEIAQSEAATGEKYVNTWMHAGAVRVDQEKMSKSLGNFFTIRDVLEKYNPEVVRYFLLASQYRSPINYSEDGLKAARQSLERFYTALEGVQAAEVVAEGEWVERFKTAMDDDFNTAEAFAMLFDLAKQLNIAKKEGYTGLAAQLAGYLKLFGSVLGLFDQDPTEFLKGVEQEGALTADQIEAMIEARKQARLNKDFAESDRIRDELLSQGITLKDTREGTSWVRE